jgi:hypothetical protein
MSTEPTRPAEHVITPDDRCPCGQPQEGSGYCSYACFSKYEMGSPLMDAETPRLPAVDAPQPLTPSVGGTGSRTGGLKAQGSAQAIEGTPLDTVARILVGSDWDDGIVYTDLGHRDDIRSYAVEIDAALRPVHYREAAASLRAIADHMPDTSSAADLRPGIHYAATLIGHTADDLTEGDAGA